jgi:hypothetical protein
VRSMKTALGSRTTCLMDCPLACRVSGTARCGKSELASSLYWHADDTTCCRRVAIVHKRPERISKWAAPHRHGYRRSGLLSGFCVMVLLLTCSSLPQNTASTSNHIKVTSVAVTTLCRDFSSDANFLGYSVSPHRNCGDFAYRLRPDAVLMVHDCR